MLVQGHDHRLELDRYFPLQKQLNAPPGTRVCAGDARDTLVGLLGVAVASGLANQLGIFEGTTVALLSMEISYRGAVQFGDTIHLEMKVIEKKESSKPDRGIITFSTDIINQNGDVVTTGKWVVMMTRKQG